MTHTDISTDFNTPAREVMNGHHALVLRETPLPRTRRGSAAESSTRFASFIARHSDTTSTNVSTCVSMGHKERKSDKGHAIDAQSGRSNMTDGTVGERCQEEGTLCVPHPRQTKGRAAIEEAGSSLFPNQSIRPIRRWIRYSLEGESGQPMGRTFRESES